VGNSTYKIYVRYREILKSIALFMPDEFVALEFGSGSSTILLYSHPQVSQLISIEEDRSFQPSIKDSENKWSFLNLRTKLSSWNQYSSRIFENFAEFVSKADLVYVDGPSTSQNEFIMLAEPNLELLMLDNLGNKLILIDCRTLTVCELSLKLETTHRLIPSKASVREYHKFLQTKNLFPHLEHLISDGVQLARQTIGFQPTRTSMLVPKLQISNHHLEGKRR
jgi:hypothetical protein